MREPQLELFHIGPPEQLPLIPYRNPLAERFDSSFFAAIPTLPGIYRMRDERENLLYVGKAKNLRIRVRSYARAAPTSASPKVLRLLPKIRTIEWEEHPSEKEALLRENDLLRTHRPPFNVANTQSHTYSFFHLADDEAGTLRIHLGMTIDPAYADIYGAFKGVGLSLRTYRALVRLLWMEAHANPKAAHLPAILMNRRRLSEFSVPYAKDLSAIERRIAYRRLKQFFNGTASTLLRSFTALAKAKSLDTFSRSVIEADLETLKEFHASHAKRNYRVKRETEFKDHLIPQDRLDDLFVIAKKWA